MLNNSNDLKVEQLERRALKSYKLIEVYKKDINSKRISNFLKNQQAIPFNDIEKILLSSSDETLPIGIAMVDLKFNNIVGFAGTFFSSRIFNGENQFFCNIHSWIVNPTHRLYSFFLISNLVKKNINLTAFTPVKSLKGLLQKFGFEKTIISENFFLNVTLFNFRKNTFKIIENSFINKCINIILSNQQGEKIEIKGNIIKKKRLRIFKILYLSNEKLSKKNYKDCLNLISSKYKIYFFSEYILDSNKTFSSLPGPLIFKKNRDVYVRSFINIGKNEILHSDLAF